MAEATASSPLLPSPGAPRRVRVLLPLPLAGAYDYRDDSGVLAPGQFVLVPLGPRQLIGVVWPDLELTGAGAPGEGAAPDASAAVPPLPEARLRAVIAAPPLPPLPAELVATIDWLASYTLSPPGAVLRMAIGAADPDAQERPQARKGFRLAPLLPAGLRLTDARRRLLASLPRLADAGADGPDGLVAAPRLLADADVSPAVADGLAAAGAIIAEALPEPPEPPAPDPSHRAASLSPAQAEAAAALTGRIGAGFSVTLLDGVTGSGKTAVYLEAVAACLAAGGSALVLLPEIALTPDWLSRFAERFGAPPAVWHSGVAQATRRRLWRRAAEGRVKVAVGARSALFLPLPGLQLIIVDEEHDGAYKQEDGVLYHARDMAVVRARQAGAACILASATPALETLANVAANRYAHVVLPERHGAARLPDVAAIDLRIHAPGRGAFLSAPLRQAVAATLAAGEQVLLFINRRGYAPLTLCRECGHRLTCPNCTAWLVEHRLAGRLVCHHCGYGRPRPLACEACGAEDSHVACGPGVERLAEEAQGLWPQARIGVLASDNPGGPAAIADLIAAVQDHRIEILIGTQMVAKGHTFPLLTLVGVVDADLGLAGGDLRAAERTFQLLHQVAGRAGRVDRPGRVLLQSYAPEHPVMRALLSGDRERFVTEELIARHAAGMPPYGRLAALIVSAASEAEADRAASLLSRAGRALLAEGQAAPSMASPGAAAGAALDGLTLLGPAPAPLAVLRGRHRRRFLLKAGRGQLPQPFIRRWLASCPLPGSVRVQVDIDPYGFW